MIVFENKFSAIIRQTQTIYDCNRPPSLCSNLQRPFDPLKDYSGRGQYLAVTKDEISHEETRSKIEHHRVQKREVRLDSPFSAVNNISPLKLFIFKTLGSCAVKRYCSQKPLKLQSYSSHVVFYVV